MNEMNTFLDIENKYNLPTDEIEGIQYWPFIRVHLFYDYFFSKKNEIKNDIGNSGSKYNIKHASLYCLTHRLKIPKIQEPDLIIFGLFRREKIGEFYESIYTYTLEKEFRSIVFEDALDRKRFLPVRSQNMAYVEQIYLWANVKYTVHKYLRTKKYRRILTSIKEHITRPITELSEIYDIKLDENDIYSEITQRIIEYQYIRHKFKKILRKVRPLAIVVVSHHSIMHGALIDAAKTEGIKTIELQHGITNTIAYQYYSANSIRILPDYLLTFSDYWKDKVLLKMKDIKVCSVGFPFFEDQINKYKKTERQDIRKTVIFISQGVIGDRLSKLSVEFQNLVGYDFRILFKLHPAEYIDWEKSYPWLYASESIEVIGKDEKGIYYWLSQSDIQVGVFSTALYEGLGFGLETYIYEIPHSEDMKSLVEAGYAEYINDAYQLKELVKKEKHVDRFSDDFWKENATDNMINTIKEILYRG